MLSDKGWVFLRLQIISYIVVYGGMMMSSVETLISKYELMQLEVGGKRKKGRPRKLWEECWKSDL